MNREIKFRIWDKRFNKMRSWNWIVTARPPIGAFFYDDNLIKMQDTGLRDKHGKEIYDGDIIHTRDNDSYNFVVRFDPKWKAWTYYLFNTFNSFIFNNEFHEVVGNIYENPELLESDLKLQSYED
jgi:hypothetical protein